MPADRLLNSSNRRMTKPIAAKLENSLPIIIAWVDQTVSDYAKVATRVSDCPFTLLNDHFAKDILDHSRVVVVPEVPFPRLSRLGLQEFHAMETLLLDGVTYKDIFFVRDGRQSASLYFHELVHIVQWARLGVNNFLLAYAAGLVDYGYERSPLERMAYQLQSGFDHRQVPSDLVKIIEKQTDEIWSVVQPFFLV